MAEIKDARIRTDELVLKINESEVIFNEHEASEMKKILEGYLNALNLKRAKVVSDLFDDELQLIKSDEIRNLVKEVMDELPLDPFLYKGASSSGKYHPAECRGVGGLTIHTKYAVQAGLVLIDQDTNLDDCMVENAYDLIIGALLLHDGFKYGLTGAEQHTDPNHPNLIADYLDQKSTASETGSDRQFYLRKLSELTRSHHGKWGDTPANNRMKEYVHIADMIASRAHLIRFNPK